MFVASRWLRDGLGWVVAGCVAVALAPAVRGQSLDGVVETLLSNNCSLLGFDSSGTPGFGSDLSRVCSNGAQGIPSASGGGAASPQASALSAENSLIQQRLERAKRKKKRAGGTAGTASTASRGRSGSIAQWEDDDQDGGGASSSSRGFNLFGSGSYEGLDRSLTPFEDAYDSSVIGGAIGFDYQFNDTVVAGLVAGYRRQEGDFQQGGDLETTTIEPTVFVSVLPSERTFLHFVAGYGAQSSDVHRSILYVIADPVPPGVTTVASGTAASSPDANELLGAAQFGYDFAAGRFTFGPRVGASYNRNTIDPYTETGTTGLELRAQEREVTSFQGVVGFYGSAAFSVKNAVLLPQLGVDYVHEFEDDASIVTAQFAQDLRGPDATTFTYQTSVPDSDFFNAQLGLGVVFARGVQMFVNVRSMFGNDLFDNTSAVIGVRFEL